MEKISIVYKKVEDLVPYENNPRNNDSAVDAVANSIKEFGFKVPVVIDAENNVVAGHTRIKACKKLGVDEVPCIIADDLDEEQVKAFRLADNKAGELATWDLDKLNVELDELKDVGIDMTDYGFLETEDVNLDDFFTDAPQEEKEEKKQTVKCPYCGKEFEI